MIEEAPGSLGRRVARCREQLGWTQKRLAEASGLSVTFISELENGHRTIGSDGLLAIADALGASVDYLLKGTLDSPRPQEPLVIPPELAQAADERAWSLSETRDLLKFHQMVLARRGQTAKADSRARRLTKEEWVQLHDRLFGDGPLA